jgi:phage terminase large subunit
MKLTYVFKQNVLAYQKGYRYIINQGGTSSSKTWSILQLLLLIALRKEGWLISVVSESLPHLKSGALRDFTKILEQAGMYAQESHNRSSNSFAVGSSTVEFFSADDSAKMRGARRDVLFMNECNNVDKRAFDELTVRTKVCTFLDYNPVSEFWVNDFMLARSKDDYKFIQSTYKDNQYLDHEVVKEIEARRDIDPTWWRVFGEGEVGRYEGVVFTNWSTCNELPDTPKRVIAVDWGFSNDPTAIVDVRYSDGQIYLDELVYRTQMTNGEIGSFLLTLEGKPIVVCDSAEPKSIAELQLMGVRAIAADKGADSLRAGIDAMKQYPMSITERSTNGIKEYRNYRWKTDKNGKSINVPTDYWNHFIDAARYGITYLLGSIAKQRLAKLHIPR